MISAKDAAVFTAEIAVYCAVGIAGWQVHWLVGAAAVLAMALWWGFLHAPKARVHLPPRMDLGLRCAWFVLGALAAGWLLRR